MKQLTNTGIRQDKMESSAKETKISAAKDKLEEITADC
jgi:hypothetical protein